MADLHGCKYFFFLSFFFFPNAKSWIGFKLVECVISMEVVDKYGFGQEISRNYLNAYIRAGWCFFSNVKFP